MTWHWGLMQKITIAFVAGSLALALVVIYLWQQLRDERAPPAQRGEQSAQRREQHVEVVSDPPAAHAVATAESAPAVDTTAAVPPAVRAVPDTRVINPLRRQEFG